MSAEIVWEGKYIKVVKDGTWEYVSRARGIQAAVILAVEDGHVLLVEQYRVPLGRRCLELPAGLVGDVGTHLDLFDLLRLLRLACEVRFLLRLVLELADIEELGDGRISVGRHLDQVQTDLARLLHRLARVHYAKIFTVLIDHADLGRHNEFVEARAVHWRRLPGHGRTDRCSSCRC